MKLILLLVAIAAIVEATFAYSNVYRVPAPVGENKGKCILDGEVLEKGYNKLSQCRVVHCFADGAYNFYGCPKTSVEGCERGEIVDDTLDYPDCCRWTYICNDGPNGTYVISK